MKAQTQTRYDRYREHRQKYGMPAHSVFRWIRAEMKGAHDFDVPDVGQVETVSRDGFEIRLKSEIDEWPDTSWIGTYQDEWTEGAFDRFRGKDGVWREYRYFVPAISYQEHYKGLRDMKYGRTQADLLAREYTRRDFERMEALDEGAWCFLVLSATAYRNGIELGSASVCGVESDSDEAHHRETFDDLIAEAVDDAKTALAELCQNLD